MTESIPERIALRFDASAERYDEGRTVVGGTPRRLLQLTPKGSELLDAWIAGAPVGTGRGAQALARRLFDAGVAHPIPGVPDQLVQVSVVLPVKDDGAAVRALVRTVVADTRVAEVIVVDDASAVPIELAPSAAQTPVRVVRRAHCGGPGVARNDGWPDTSEAFVAFIDADVIPQPGWLDRLLGHFADPTVAAVAPRVASTPSTANASLLARYESAASPLDLGDEPGPVHPSGRLRYVPSAALVVRRSALDAVGGFDPGLRFGEDVDWCWRAHDAGWRLRYEPAAMVHHRPRPTLGHLLAQRRGYGTAAAALEARHPGRVRPLETNPWTLAIAAVLLGPGTLARRGIAAVALGAASAVPVHRRLAGKTARPAALTASLVGRGHLLGLGWLAHAVRRAWLPPIALASVLGVRPARRLLAAAGLAALVPGNSLDQRTTQPAHLALRLLDDAAYCTGVWQGAWGQRSPDALLPRRARSSGN